MAIIKHISSKNKNYSDVIEYLIMQHNEETGAVILDEYGEMIEREGYLIQGINCTTDDFAEQCLLDRIRFGVKGYESEVTTHQYILSFSPEDAERGLTVEFAQEQGIRFAQKYFPGHRTIVCTHPDGASHSGNIHVHIVISALRFEDRMPEENYMRLRDDGSVKPSEYKAGCRHQDTARLRLHMQAHIQEYCRRNGYIVTASRAERKVTSREYKAGLKAKKQLEQDNLVRLRNGLKPVQTTPITHKEELRRVIANASETTNNWDAFIEKLRTGYTRSVEHRAGTEEIPYLVRKKLWSSYKKSKEDFWKTHKRLAESYSGQLEETFNKLRLHKQKRPQGKFPSRNYQKEITTDLREQVASLKSKQQKLRLVSKIFQVYSKAVALALSNGMEDDARICLAQMEALTSRLEGRWTDGWDKEGSARLVLDGKVQSRITWLQTRTDELELAENFLDRIQEEIRKKERIQPEISEEPFPVEVKITRGSISFKHPDMEHWVRGKSLGTSFELEAITRKLKYHKISEKVITR